MDIIEYLNSVGIRSNLKEKNNAYIECPVCHHENLSFNVYSGVWQCWSAMCVDQKYKGNFEELCKELQITIPQGERVKFREPPRSDNKFTKEDANAILEAAENKTKVIEWATSRGLDGAFVCGLGIGYDDRQNAIVFPFRNEKGELIGAKYKSMTAQWIKGKEPLLYTLDPKDLKKDKIILVEGEVDAITLKQFGMPVAATLGATKNKGFTLLANAKQIYLGFDMDAAGDIGADKAAQELGVFRCKKVTWGAKDPNDWLQLGLSKEQLTDVLKNAKPMTQETTSLDAMTALNQFFEENEKGVKPRRSWGYNKLDSFTRGIGGGTLVGVLAESGTGKTTFIINAIRNHILQGINCGFASLEEHPIHEVTPKLFSCILGRNITTLGVSREEVNLIESDLKKIHLYNKSVDLQGVMDWVRECYYFHDCRMIAIDYFQLLVKDEESTQDIKQTIFAIKNLTKEMPDLCILLVIQPKQTGEWRKFDGSVAKPTKMDGSKARGGSAINQTVDMMLTIKGVENHPNLTQYEYTKVRGHLNVNKRDWVGKFTQLEYNHDTLRMTELSMLYYGG